MNRTDYIKKHKDIRAFNTLFEIMELIGWKTYSFALFKDANEYKAYEEYLGTKILKDYENEAKDKWNKLYSDIDISIKENKILDINYKKIDGILYTLTDIVDKDEDPKHLIRVIINSLGRYV